MASKAYGVTRAAAVPRVVPRALGLVKAKDLVTIRFDLVVDYEALEEALGS